jgi:hypothetical protein
LRRQHAFASIGIGSSLFSRSKRQGKADSKRRADGDAHGDVFQGDADSGSESHADSDPLGREGVGIPFPLKSFV